MSTEQNYGLIREGTSNAVLKPIPIPKLRDDYILLRTVAIALNPTDWTTIDAKGDDGSLMGCDYAGIVEEVGKAVTKPFKKGDRVAGIGHGGNDANHETGAFARVIAVKGDIQMKIPDHISFEQAATIGSGIMTAGYALYHVLKLPLPGDDVKGTGEPILIYGGSTATGTLAIQLARLSGRKVVTTCSPKHFDLVKQRGAHEIFDYRSPTVATDLQTATSNTLTQILDTVAIPSSAGICAKAFSTSSSSAQKIYCNLLGEDCPNPDVQSIFFLGYSMFGEEYMFEGDTYPASPEDFDFAKTWTSLAEILWREGKWVNHPETVRKGGFRGAVKGMQEMREGRGPSGVKWVYRVDETSWP